MAALTNRRETARVMLCRLCNTCGELYFLCPHYNGWTDMPFETAQQHAVKLLLRLKFDSKPSALRASPEELKKTIHEVFCAETEQFAAMKVT